MNTQNKKSIDIRTVDKDSLTELWSDLPDREERQGQTGIHACYRVGEVAVAFEYAHNGNRICDILAMMVEAGL